MARIKYRNNADDLNALCRFIARHNNAARARWRLLASMLPLVILFAAGFMAIAQGSALPLIVGVVVSAAFFALTLACGMALLTRKLTLLYSASILGEHILQNAAYGFEEWAGWSKTDYTWHGIARFEKTENRFFVLIRDNAAFVVTRERVQEGDYDAFAEELENAAPDKAALSPSP